MASLLESNIADETIVDCLAWWSSSSGAIELQIDREDAESCHHSGQCDDDVKAVSEKQYLADQLSKIDANTLSAELKEYGAWDDDERKDHAQNVQRLVWIACGDVAEGSA